MDMRFKRGYIVYKNNKSNFVTVAPHSGPALENPTSRDDNSETVGSKCWNRFGGKFVVSNMPRNRVLGIDFNRDIPSLNEAVGAYDIFVKNQDLEAINSFRKKYGWVSKNEGDYYDKLSIYQNFWADVDSGNPIVFLHRAFPRIKAIPSIIDIVTFKDEGTNKNKIRRIVDDLNKEYAPLMKKLEYDYKKMILFEEKRLIYNTIKTFKTFNISKIRGETRDGIMKDIEKIREYADENFIRALSQNFNPDTFLAAVDNSLKNSPPPRITIENVFNGSLALGPKRKLFPTTKTILEIEPSRFMNFWYPETVAEIIGKLLKRIDE